MVLKTTLLLTDDRLTVHGRCRSGGWWDELTMTGPIILTLFLIPGRASLDGDRGGLHEQEVIHQSPCHFEFQRIRVGVGGEKEKEEKKTLH